MKKYNGVIIDLLSWQSHSTLNVLVEHYHLSDQNMKSFLVKRDLEKVMILSFF